MQNMYKYTWSVNNMNKVSASQKYFCDSTEESRNDHTGLNN